MRAVHAPLLYCCLRYLHLLFPVATTNPLLRHPVPLPLCLPPSSSSSSSSLTAQFLTQIVRLGRLLSMQQSSAFSLSAATIDPFAAIVAAAVSSQSSPALDASLGGGGGGAGGTLGPSAGGLFDSQLVAPPSPSSGIALASGRLPPASPTGPGGGFGGRGEPFGSVPPPRHGGQTGPGLLREFSPRSQTPNPRRPGAPAPTPLPLSHHRRMSTGTLTWALLQLLPQEPLGWGPPHS